MAVPTAAQCKLLLSFDMVAKTMTASVQSEISTQGTEGLIYGLQYAVVVDPLNNEYPITDIYYDGDAGQGTQEFDAPLDADGKVLNGSYKILIPFVYVNDGSTTTYTDVDSFYTLDYTKVVVCLEQTVNCITPSFVSKDATDYRVTDPTSQGYITPVTVTYEHNLYYPVTSNGYPDNTTETSDLTITRGYQEFYQGTQTGTVLHEVSYTFVDGLVVTDTIEGDLETKVDCSTLTCTLTCGLNNAGTAMFAEQGVNEGEFQKKQANLILATTYTSLVQFNIDCGDSDMATFWMAKAKLLIGNCCNGCDDCGAADGTPISGYGN